MPQDLVEFIVEYGDGSTAQMAIDRYTLGMGDFVARIVAMERQLDGTLPEGTFVRVRRATE